MSRPFNKFEAIQLAERIAYKEQEKFIALGYKPFMLMVDFEDLTPKGWWGYHADNSDTIVLDIWHWQNSKVAVVQETIQHEMVHMYLDRYHRLEMEFAHGKEFHELFEKITGKPYVHYDLVGHHSDMYHELDEQEQKRRELTIKLGTIERKT